MLKKFLSLSGLSLVCFMQFSCGDKSAADDVNIEPKWADSNVLTPNTSALITGDAQSNKPFSISFSLADEHGNEIIQDPNHFTVRSTPPPAGKTSLSLSDDMNTALIAGPEACNGNYTLFVIGKNKAVSKKPLNFIVQNGVEAEHCTHRFVAKENPQYKTYANATIGNRMGRDHSGFDLLTNTAVARDAANSDVQDITEIAGPISKKLGSKTGARFIEHSGLSFETATYNDVKSAFTGNQTDTTGLLSEGHVVLVYNARNTTYYILKITEINSTGVLEKASRKENNGYIRFQYRKLGSEFNV